MNYKSIAWVVLTGIAISLPGCSDNPGSWPQPKVEAKVAESLDLSQITLTPGTEQGVFTGTGKHAGGETFKLTVTQNASDKRISWEADGDRGTSEVGSYGLE